MSVEDLKKVIAVVSDFKFLNRNFNNLYHQLRVNGKYDGEILVITSLFTLFVSSASDILNYQTNEHTLAN